MLSGCVEEGLLKRSESPHLENLGHTYNLVPYTAPTFPSPTADEEKDIILGIEVGCVDGVAQADLGAGHWRSHLLVERKIC